VLVCERVDVQSVMRGARFIAGVHGCPTLHACCCIYCCPPPNLLHCTQQCKMLMPQACERMYGWMDGWMDGWVGGWVGGWARRERWCAESLGRSIQSGESATCAPTLRRRLRWCVTAQLEVAMSYRGERVVQPVAWGSVSLIQRLTFQGVILEHGVWWMVVQRLQIYPDLGLVAVC